MTASNNGREKCEAKAEPQNGHQDKTGNASDNLTKSVPLQLVQSPCKQGGQSEDIAQLRMFMESAPNANNCCFSWDQVGGALWPGPLKSD